MNGIQVLNSYRLPEVQQYVNLFLRKFYDDQCKRIFLLGINPGRLGGGLTGISFTDPYALKNYCGIHNRLPAQRELSSDFIYQVILAFGGAEHFFQHFFMSAVCPLGFVKDSRNFNYYDDPGLLKLVTPFIRSTLQQQIAFGANRKELVCIGTGNNAGFLESLNMELGYFEKVITLPHPRFIMQYRRKQAADYIQSYVDTLKGCLNQLLNS